ncbi:MAG: energy-coupling factor transporter transmembrane component T [Candidatus Hodarchaeales archaeon]
MFHPDSISFHPLSGIFILLVQFILLLVLAPLPLALLTIFIIFEFLLVGGSRSMINLLWGIMPLIIFLTGTTLIFSGFTIALGVFLRIICGALSFSFFITFTNPSDLTRIFESLHVPPRWAIIPSLTLTFVPRVIKDAQETIETLALRGEIGGKWNILKWMPRVFAIIIASSLYRSEFLAQALYFRGFGLPSRTHYRKIAFKRVDLLRSSFWSLILVLILQINSLSFS